MKTLRLKLKPNQISKLIPVLQKGFFLRASLGSTIEDLLLGAGFSHEYLKRRVQTVFLNGIAVDDLQAETIKENSVIALSAAMPGLVGAIFRKDSPISGLRSRMTIQENVRPRQDANELVRLKLFNVIAEEMGPELLQKGIILEAADLRGLLENRRELLEPALTAAELDGQLMEPENLFSDALPLSHHVFVSASEELPPREGL